MQEVEVKLSDWVFRAIQHSEVLTLHRDYFRLRKPLERRIYEIARKHCGRQSEWRISLEKLQRKCGSCSTLKEFRRLVGAIIEEDRAHKHIPDYTVTFDGDDMVVFRNRGAVAKTVHLLPAVSAGHISGDGYEAAKLVAPGWDIYHLEREWRDWITVCPHDTDSAFTGFCRKWYERRGQPR